MMNNLYSSKESIGFYEKRYVEGYMEDWSIEKEQRLTEVIQSLGLSGKGEVLDFGCGNGVLTETIRQALPGWKVYGTDISKKAIQNAKLWFPNCIFFEIDDSRFRKKYFDLVFTNHVFEHVNNLQETFDQMVDFLKHTSGMLHILPCGNKGSFEHNVCLLRKDGIDPKRENRFFFEENGHVRRLTTEQFEKLAEEKCFSLKQASYSNQYYGAIDWFTNSNPGLVLLFTGSRLSINKSAKWRLVRLRLFLMTITLIRLPAQVVEKYLKKRNKMLKHHILFIVTIPFFLFSLPMHLFWKNKAKEEWVKRKKENNGSEMTLFFSRNL